MLLLLLSSVLMASIATAAGHLRSSAAAGLPFVGLTMDQTVLDLMSEFLLTNLQNPDNSERAIRQLFAKLLPPIPRRKKKVYAGVVHSFKAPRTLQLRTITNEQAIAVNIGGLDIDFELTQNVSTKFAIPRRVRVELKNVDLELFLRPVVTKTDKHGTGLAFVCVKHHVTVGSTPKIQFPKSGATWSMIANTWAVQYPKHSFVIWILNKVLPKLKVNLPLHKITEALNKSFKSLFHSQIDIRNHLTFRNATVSVQQNQVKLGFAMHLKKSKISKEKSMDEYKMWFDDPLPKRWNTEVDENGILDLFEPPGKKKFKLLNPLHGLNEIPLIP